MKKLGLVKSLVGSLLVSGLVASNCLGASNNDDFTLSRAQYMNFTGKDKCVVAGENIYDKVMADNGSGILPYIGGISWRNNLYTVDVFTDEKYENGRLHTVFFYNSLNACNDFNKNFEILAPYIGKK